jgi:4'-phosphopantetheinyl transferase EntD
VIADILPPTVASVETFGDIPGAVLFPEEEVVIAGAVDKRRREFTAARACARAALAKLGHEPTPILPGERGAPQWPPGVVGSITHCHGYRASAVARTHNVLALGIDAEPDGPVPDGVLGAVADAGEQAGLATLAAATPGVCWDRLLFSAKEAVYKAWFPLTRRWLGFEDASVSIDPADGTFTARLHVTGRVPTAGPLGTLTGRWLARNGLIVTAVVLLAVPGHP